METAGMTRNRAFKRGVRERAAATGESYTTARSQLLRHRADGPDLAVITNGDSVAGTLREAGLGDVVIAWRDILHDGPVLDLPPGQLRRLRARHLAARHGLRVTSLERGLAEGDRALASHASQRIQLWFEADLHDQLQVIQILTRLGRLHADPDRIAMISIGEHPDRARFGGLGELTGEQLAALLPLARPLSAAAFELAASAWSAFTAESPLGLVELAGIVSPELRYLGDAIVRLLQEYPSSTDGLSITQRRLLLGVERGITRWPDLLRAHWRSEPRPFMGDIGIKAELDLLATAPQPALAESTGRFGLTDFGREVLAGRADWVAVNGIDRWIGGVHLEGHRVPWRYDERRETLVAVR